MKNYIVILGAACMMASCTSKTEIKTEVKTVNKDSIKTVIEGMEARYAKGLETKNIEDMMSYYSDDIMSFQENTDPTIGAAAMRKSNEEMFVGMPPGLKIQMDPSNLAISADGTLVVNKGGYTAILPSGQIIDKGDFLSTFEIRNGKYVCTREMVTAAKPPAPPANADKATNKG